MRGRKADQDRRREFPSIYIGNIQKGTSMRDLWRTFSEVGEVADIFIVSKTDIRNGSERNFAFVRFFDFRAMQEALKVSNEFILRGEKLIVRKTEPTRRKKEPEWRRPNAVQGKQKSYAQVVKEGVTGIQQKGDHPDRISNDEYKKEKGEWLNVRGLHEWIERSILGDMREIDNQKKIRTKLSEAGVENRVCYLGGMKTLTIFSDKKPCRSIKEPIAESSMDGLESGGHVQWILVAGKDWHGWRSEIFQ